MVYKILREREWQIYLRLYMRSALLRMFVLSRVIALVMNCLINKCFGLGVHNRSQAE